MESYQIAAIEHHKSELIKVLRPVVLFLSYLESNGIIGSEERELVEKSSFLTSDQLLKVLDSLQHNGKGWSAIITYLKGDNREWLADKLDKTTLERLTSKAVIQSTDNEDNAATRPDRTALQTFSHRLADYYLLHYSQVPTMCESFLHVKDVRLPLLMDCQVESFHPAYYIDHIEMCNQLKHNERQNVALIKGDPGMGKTTLAKKIAHDWAVNYGATEAQQFILVLAVPLRSAGKSHRFDQLATDYFLSVLDSADIDKEELISEIRRLKSQLLVLLDGLDEYRSYSEGPFNCMFAASSWHSSAKCDMPLPMITFKVIIITSKPYAWNFTNQDFVPLRYDIMSMDVDHLGDFVNLFCQTSQGVDRVTDFIKVNADWVIHVPLILRFVCYLADSVQEIPTNMTMLYDKLIRQMIWRENRLGRLVESIDIKKWKEANVVKTVGELAFKEIIRKPDYPLFPTQFPETSHVTNDSFICGFLLQKYDFTKDIFVAEFPHRSIQDFFAALHCYLLMLAGCKDELGDIRKLILRCDSQFGRFFFGICSLEGKFVQMADWLNTSQCGSANIWSFVDEIDQFGTSLIDCSPEDNTLMGQRLYQSIGHLEETISSQMQMHVYTLGRTLHLHNLSAEFKEALHLVDLTRDRSGFSHDWFLADNRQSARLSVIATRLPELMEEKFDQINIFIWVPSVVNRVSGLEWKTLVNQIQSLPLVKTFIMSTVEKPQPDSDRSVFVRVGYSRTASVKLSNFRFDCRTEQSMELMEAVPDEKLVRMKTNLIFDSPPQSIFLCLKVTVDSCESQSALIYSLIRLSLDY